MDKEPGEWEKHEMDRELLKQLDHLFNANNFLPTAEKRKERVQKAISDLPEWVRPRTYCNTQNIIVMYHVSHKSLN